MRLKATAHLVLLAGALLTGCGDDDPPGGPSPTPSPTASPTTMKFDFAADGAAWQTGFADYSPGMESSIEFESGIATVPPNVSNASGLLLGGRNVSDDLALFAWRQIENLQPSRLYRINAEIELATNAPADCVGIGGPPGEAVAIKAGAADEMPAKVTENGRIRVNVDKGNQSQGGSEVVVLGTLASEMAGACTDPVYARKTLRTGDSAPQVRSTSDGKLWLFITSDSGFEGRSEFYLLDASFTLTPL